MNIYLYIYILYFVVFIHLKFCIIYINYIIYNSGIPMELLYTSVCNVCDPVRILAIHPTHYIIIHLSNTLHLVIERDSQRDIFYTVS